MQAFQRYAPLAGRILIALPFLSFAMYKAQNRGMMSEWLQFQGLPMPGLLVMGAVLIEFTGAIALITGFKVRWIVPVMIVYLIPVHFFLHDFWTLDPGPERQAQLENFGKGLMIMGGLLFVTLAGAGPLSLDARQSHVKHLQDAVDDWKAG